MQRLPILFLGGSFKGEVWVMENLPAARPAKTSLRDRLKFRSN